MSNEAIRLPSGEVSSSVHYQKTIAASKNLGSLVPVGKLNKMLKEKPRENLLINTDARSIDSAKITCYS
jgi:hypothetical protein